MKSEVRAGQLETKRRDLDVEAGVESAHGDIARAQVVYGTTKKGTKCFAPVSSRIIYHRLEFFTLYVDLNELTQFLVSISLVSRLLRKR